MTMIARQGGSLPFTVVGASNLV